MTVMRRWWPLALAILACVYALLSFDWPSIGRALRGISLVPLLAEMALVTLAVFLACALRWVAINKLPWRRPVIWNVYVYVSVVIGAAIATPMQLGELLKVKFAHASGMSLGESAVNLALERVIDLATIAAMACGGLAFAVWQDAMLALLATLLPFLAGLTAPTILQVLARRLAGQRYGEKLRRLAGSPLPISRLLAVALCTVAKWGLTLLMWWLILRASAIDASVWQAMLLVGAVTGVSILSMVPGGIGVQELSVRALLVAAGHDPVQAEVAAVALRLFTPVMIVLGLAHLPWLASKPPTSERLPSHG